MVAGGALGAADGGTAMMHDLLAAAAGATTSEPRWSRRPAGSRTASSTTPRPVRRRPRARTGSAPATASRSTRRTAGSGWSPTTACSRPARSSTRSTSCSRRRRSRSCSATAAPAVVTIGATRRPPMAGLPAVTPSAVELSSRSTTPSRGPRGVCGSTTCSPRRRRRRPAVRRRPTDLCTIGYTSGTTGHPKGAMQSHRAVLLNCALTATMHVRTARRRRRHRAPRPRTSTATS